MRPRAGTLHNAEGAAFGVAAAASGVGLLATSGWLITRAAERPPVLALSIAIGAVQAFAIGRGVLRYFERLRIHERALNAMASSRLALFDTLEPLVPAARRGFGAGEVLTAFVTDTSVVAESAAKREMAIIDIGASVSCAVLIDCLIAWRSGLVLAAGALLIGLWAILSAHRATAGIEDLGAQRRALAEEVAAAMRSARELAALGRTDLVIERLRAVERRGRGASSRRAHSLASARAIGTGLSGITLAAVLASALAAHARGISGVLVAVLSLSALAALGQCEALPDALFDAGEGRAARRRLAELLQVPSPPPGSSTHLWAASEEAAALDAAVVERDGARLLEDVHLRLSRGERLGLLGASGAGKSTALHALLGFLPCAVGSARLDGVEVASLDRGSIARLAAWMPDETHLFETTLGANLRIGRPDASDAECIEVLRGVGLGSWYDSLEHGLDTPLEPNSVSAGERQRIGLARTLLSRAPVLLLDEPTAHVDPGSAEELLARLRGSRARSILLTSHEPDLGRFIDASVELHGGRSVVGSQRLG